MFTKGQKVIGFNQTGTVVRVLKNGRVNVRWHGPDSRGFALGASTVFPGNLKATA